jgi:tetratricopeptide (TPR) repeat protein
MSGVGDAHMSISVRSPEAQAFFDQGLALLHSFWFFEADRAFERAAVLDPSCAMAQWGIAMVGLNDARRDAALKKARALASGITPHERLYVEAAAARYQGVKEVVLNNRFLGATEPFRQALRHLVSEFPDDLNAKVFLANALIAGYERDGKPKAGTIEAITLLEQVLAKEPKNAAAHHLMIHVYEASPHPERAAASADLYGKLAPKVGHALHMPGHLYVHLDRWQDAANAFEQSAARDREYLRAEGLPSDSSGGPIGHNLHFLATVYGYQGRFQEGMRAARESVTLGEPKSLAAIEGRLAILRMLVRFERWGDILDGHTLPEPGEFEVFKAWVLFATGMARANTGDLSGARAALASLEQEIARLRAELPQKSDLPQRGIQVRQLLPLGPAPYELKGELLLREGKTEEAMATLRSALAEEQKYGYSEPPLYPHPMEEVLGKAALTAGRASDAEAWFQAALKRDPGSGRALFGLMMAYRRMGKKGEATKMRVAFERAWQTADRDLPEFAELKKTASASNTR